MNSDFGPRVLEVLPQEAWNELTSSRDARLIDVRTTAEWSFVGVPDSRAMSHDLVTIQWVQYPDMAPNEAFVAELLGALGDAMPTKLYFICRSGVRSLSAARCVADATADLAGAPVCVNVANGFEGDLDAEQRRGRLNGWKASGLPWRQN